MATDPTKILLAQNQVWKKEIDQKYPGFFKESAEKKQSPKVSMTHLLRISLLIHGLGSLDWMRGLSRPGVCDH